MGGKGEADVRKSAEALYARGQVIWDPSDRWNSHKKAKIEGFFRAECRHLLKDAGAVLNAGSGRDQYGWMPPSAINTDLFLEQVKYLPNAVVADIRQLPFAGSIFDLAVCVGSVLNYVSLLEALNELSRCVRVGGHAIIHFESSNSFEQWFSKSWNKNAAAISTINNGRDDRIWVYSPRYVKASLESNGFRVRKSAGFHILSAVATRLGAAQNTAATLGRLDSFLKFAGLAGDDQIILAEKVA